MKRKKRLSKKDIRNRIVSDYHEQNSKYSKLLKEIEVERCSNSILYFLEKLSYKSKLPRNHKQSLGEKFIESLLISNYIYYLKEVEFNGCLNPSTKKKLRFDFFLPEKKICIEFDGIQHEQYVEEFDKGDFEKLKIRQRLDSIKNEFCKNNGLLLIRVKYNDINIKEELLRIILKK